MLEFQPVAAGIYLLETPFNGLWSGVYLVRRDGNFLIDSGATAAGVDEVIRPALRALGFDLSDLDALLCTHSHGDHVGGHRRIRELAGVPCGVLEAGADKLRDPLKYSRLIRAAFPGYSPEAPAGLAGVEPDFLLRDQETIGGLQLIHTPGHDTDTVCFWDRETGALLTGDSVQGAGTCLQGCALYMDLPGYRYSLRRLSGLAPALLVAGHPYLPWNRAVIAGTAAVAAALAEARSITERYDAVLAAARQDGIADPARLAGELIRAGGGRFPEYLFLAMHTVAAHLNAFKTGTARF